jgi:adenine deaminase
MKTADERKTLVQVNFGKLPPDLVIQGGTLVNVNTREIQRADIIIKGQRIAAVEFGETSWTGKCPVIDATGQYLAPGFIDPHIHIESSAITVTEFARTVVPRGITTIAEDPHEIANVLGLEGIKLFIKEAKGVPLNFLLRVPGRIPANAHNIETSGGEITLKQTIDILDWEEAVCLAGDINPNLILSMDPQQFAKIAYTIKMKKTISGQSPCLTGAALNAYIAAGVEDSHVSKDTEEILDIARHGMRPLITHRSMLFGVSDYTKLVKAINDKNLDTRLMSFTTDDVAPNVLYKQGHLDERVRLAIAAGLNPVTAYQLATCNTAEHLRIRRDFGELSPGKFADILILDNLESVKVDKVISHGKLVAEKGKLVSDPIPFIYPQRAMHTMKTKSRPRPVDFQIKVGKTRKWVKARVINPGERDREIFASLPVQGGVVHPDAKKNIASVTVLERHNASGDMANGFVTGYGINSGAVASSVNHDAHNIIALGLSFEDMAMAVDRLVSNGGGYVTVKDGKILAEIKLPIAGLISDLPLKTVAEEFEVFEHILKDKLGWNPHGHPTDDLTFLCLPNIHRITITDKGVFDTSTMKPVNVIIK